jgi:hypothetical protein
MGAEGVVRIARVAAILVTTRIRVAGVRVTMRMAVRIVRLGVGVTVAAVARMALRERCDGVRVAMQRADLCEERAHHQAERQHQQQGEAKDGAVAAEDGHRALA